LLETERWIAPQVERIFAVLDNLSAHRATVGQSGLEMLAELADLGRHRQETTGTSL